MAVKCSESVVRKRGRIRLRSSLQSLRDVDAAVECVWDVTVEREGSDKPALAAQWITRIVF